MRVLTVLLLTAAAAPAAAPAQPPAFDPLAFFDGHTEGEGRISVMLRHSHAVYVSGRGHMEGDALVLDQRVEEDGQPERHRSWRLAPAGPGRYTGTLSDAKGPVTGIMENGRLRLRFHLKGGLSAEQWLSPGADAHLLDNHMVIRKLGITVATLDETIRKVGE